MEEPGAQVIDRFILDSSLALSWCFDEERTTESDQILDLFAEGAIAHVPYLWLWEINNVFCLALKSNRLSTAKHAEKTSLLQSLPITFDLLAHSQCWNATLRIAQQYRLTVYDASYLEMAFRLNAPIGSLDRELRAAARRANVPMLPVSI